jgi:hypothetical protein
MKKTLIFPLKFLLVVGLLAYNFSYVQGQQKTEKSETILNKLEITPGQASMPAGCIESDGNGGVVVSCSSSSSGCCFTCIAVGFFGTCSYTGSPQDYCMYVGLGCM